MNAFLASCKRIGSANQSLGLDAGICSVAELAAMAQGGSKVTLPRKMPTRIRNMALGQLLIAALEAAGHNLGDNTGPRMLTVKAAAEYLGIGTTKFRELEAAGMQRFPGTTGEAEILARLAHFADVYVAEWTDPYLEVTRIRGQRQQTLEGSQQTLPTILRDKLGSWGFSRGVNDELVARFRKPVPSVMPSSAGVSPNASAVPCRLRMGQCFQSAGPTSSAPTMPAQPPATTATGATP